MRSHSVLYGPATDLLVIGSSLARRGGGGGGGGGGWGSVGDYIFPSHIKHMNTLHTHTQTTFTTCCAQLICPTSVYQSEMFGPAAIT